MDGLGRAAEGHCEREGELVLALLGREADHPAAGGPLEQNVDEGFGDFLVALNVKEAE